MSIVGIVNETELYLVPAHKFEEGIASDAVFTMEKVKNTTLEELKRLILKV